MKKYSNMYRTVTCINCAWKNLSHLIDDNRKPKKEHESYTYNFMISMRVFLRQTKRNFQLLSLRSSYSSIGKHKNIKVRDWDGDAPDNIITNKVDTRADIKINGRGERARQHDAPHAETARETCL